MIRRKLLGAYFVVTVSVLLAGEQIADVGVDAVIWTIRVVFGARGLDFLLTIIK